MAVLSTIGVASFVSYSRAQTLQQASNGLVTTLNTAKARALSQVKPSICLDANKKIIEGYQVVLDGTNMSYDLLVLCNDAPYHIWSSPTKLPTGVTFDTTKWSSSLPKKVTITFLVLTGGFASDGGDIDTLDDATKGELIITLNGAQGTTAKVIAINPGGIIE